MSDLSHPSVTIDEQAQTAEKLSITPTFFSNSESQPSLDKLTSADIPPKLETFAVKFIVQNLKLWSGDQEAKQKLAQEFVQQIIEYVLPLETNPQLIR